MIGEAAQSQNPHATSRTTRIVMEVPADIQQQLAEPDVIYSFENLLSESPTLVVGKKRLKGRYKDVVGTDLMFEPVKESMAGFVGSSKRRLVFEDDDS